MAQDEESRGFLVSSGQAETPSSCSCCCVFRWALCIALLLAGAAVALVVCLPAKPKELSATDQEFDELAQVVLQLVKSHKLRQEAKQVAGDAEWGKDLKADSKQIMDLLRAMEGQLSPEVAAKIGIEITSDDIARILGVMGTHGHQFNLEDKKSGAFQGDMVPENGVQLRRFVAVAEVAQHRHTKKKRGSFGAGEPWTDGKVKYCFHPSATDGVKDAVGLAIQQYKKSVPCVQFVDVGHAHGDECYESPAVIITSENNGCWSYVGMLGHRKSQGLNLQSPGCDSVGTVLHELGHALGMAHEQARPDRDDYVEIHESRIRSGKEHNFDISRGGDMERPYDILSIMHYDADSFSTSNKPTITAKEKAFSFYTDDPDEYESYKMGNRVGLTQLDADQLADLYRSENGLCVSYLLGDGSKEHASCSDLLVKGEEWKDRYDQNCADYKKMEERGHIESCSKYSAGHYCCDCDGGLRLQKWSWECDLCRPVSTSNCPCQDGSFTLNGETSATTCGNPGYVKHFPFCVVDASCESKFGLGGLTLAQCGTYTGFTTKGCRCKRSPEGWSYKQGEDWIEVPTTCGNPSHHKDGDWCFVEEHEKECQGDDWGTCEIAKM